MVDRDEELYSLLSRAALAVTGRRLDGLDMATRLADLGIDSVSVLEMIGFVEDELGLRFPDDEIARVETVRDVAALVERTRRAAGAAP
jgi:acyl carrier protein